MTQLLKKSLTVLTLMTLLLTSAPAWGESPQPTPEETVVVPTSLLREATAEIDRLTLELRFKDNRLVERDSTWAAEKTYWTGRLAYAEATSAQWELRYEKLRGSWWHKHESALWLGVGVGLAAWALQ